MATYLYGRNAVRSSLQNNKVRKLFINQGLNDQELLLSAKEAGIAVDFCDLNKLNSLTNNGKHQGVVALIDDFAYTPIDQLIAFSKRQAHPFILMLAEIEDPQNLGAIARSVDALGVDGIIIKKDRAVGVTASAMKVATGAFDFVKVSQVTNLNQTIATLKQAGYWIVSSDGSATTSYLDLVYDFPLVLIVGSEGSGVPALVVKNSDFVVNIPMIGHVNSLNASVASALLIAGINSRRTNTK